MCKQQLPAYPRVHGYGQLLRVCFSQQQCLICNSTRQMQAKCILRVRSAMCSSDSQMYLELKGAKTAMHLLSIPFYHFLFFLYLKKYLQHISFFMWSVFSTILKRNMSLLDKTSACFQIWSVSVSAYIYFVTHFPF